MKNLQKLIPFLGKETSKAVKNIPKTPVIITGASSGIGQALAYDFAKRGHDVGLAARRTAVLEQMKADLEFHHKVKVVTASLDVKSIPSVGPAVELLATQLGSVGTVIVNSGITGFRATGRGKFDMDVDIVTTNLLGGMATVEAAAKIFREQEGGGHIVGISSFMALRGIAGTGAYAASKAGLDTYLDTCRAELQVKKIKVGILRAGFVKTDLMEDMSKYPFVISADQCASLMYSAIARKPVSEFVPKYPWMPLQYVVRLIPDGVWRKMF